MIDVSLCTTLVLCHPNSKLALGQKLDNSCTCDAGQCKSSVSQCADSDGEPDGEMSATCKILALAASVGMPMAISLSKRPALLRAGSSASGLFVAPA